MTRGLLFWIIMIFWALSVFFGANIFGANALYVSTGLLLVLFTLLGWDVYGAPIKGGPPRSSA